MCDIAFKANSLIHPFQLIDYLFMAFLPLENDKITYSYLLVYKIYPYFLDFNI